MFLGTEVRSVRRVDKLAAPNPHTNLLNVFIQIANNNGIL
jgi:hypothetical protein